MIQKKSAKIYLWLHVALAVALLLFPLYRLLADRVTDVLIGCFLHDRLFLYCPLCGGTRALAALLRLDLVEAFAHNAYVTVLAFLAIALDVWAFVRLCRGKRELLPMPGWAWIALAVSLVLYGVLRNYLMIVHGIDPVGDLGVFWNYKT